MTHPGSDPRRRQPDVGGRAAPERQLRPGRSEPHRESDRPVGRSSLWPDSAARQQAPQPLRAHWSPVPSDGGAPTTSRAERSASARTGRSTAAASSALPATDQAARPRAARKARRRSAFGWFVHRYGWRAYALPVLVALTVVVVVQGVRAVPVADAAAAGTTTAAATTAATTGGAPPVIAPGSSPTQSPKAPTTVTETQISTATTTAPAPSPAPSTSLSVGPDPAGGFEASMTMGQVPPGAAFVPEGAGTWHVVKGTTKPFGDGPEIFTFSVEVEDGVQSPRADQEFAIAVVSTLQDPRSWIAGKKFTLQRVDSGTPDFRVSLTSQKTIRSPEFCGYDNPLEASCFNRSVGRVFINDVRWLRGAISYHGDLGLYRIYAINHEVGHALGFGHQPCGENGGLAPVMMQQTFSTSNTDLHLMDPQTIPDDNKVCRPNPFPYPRGSTA